MSNRRFALAATMAAACLPAAPAVAKTSQPTRAVMTAAAEGSTIKAATGLGRIHTTKAPLALATDRRADVARIRGTAVAKRSAARRIRAVMSTDKSVGARLLLIGMTGNEPTFTWWKSLLTTEGVPFDTLITKDSGGVTAAMLQTSPTQGKYEGVVITPDSLTDCSVSPCVDTMGAAGWAALQAYEKSFAVREIGAYGWPSPAYGVEWGGTCGNKSNITLKVSSAGASTFSDLAGTFPTDNGVWGCEMKPLAGSSFQPMVSGPNGPVVGTFTRTDGVETMYNSIDGSDWTIHSKLLFHGMLKWVTKGVYLGAYRNYFSVDVDDVFLGNDRWDIGTKAIKEDDATTVIRMTAADVDRAVAWEASSGVSLNMLFNAAGADVSKGGRNDNGKGKKGQAPAATDPLSDALMANKSAFRWLSHTFTHADLDSLSQTDIETEIRANLDFANKNKLPGFNKTELTTGGHSGLQNPAMPAALASTGVRSIGSDASINKNTAPLGSAVELPRYPTGVYYNVGTKAEQLDEYNYLNYTLCAGKGLPGCLSAQVDWNGYVANESAMIIRHILGNDPRPHYVHQSNLADEGTLYPVADEVVRRYRSYVTTPFVQPSYTDSLNMLAQQSAWNAALAGNAVSGTISSTGLSISTTAPVAVPLSGTGVGDVYGGLRSGWKQINTGTTRVGL